MPPAASCSTELEKGYRMPGSTLPAIAQSVNIVEEIGPSGRVNRRPRHTFQVEARPYEIQPFCIAPVLPGETLQHALLQVRAVSDPIKNPLIGWWLEHYLFYVKLTDLKDAAYFQALMLSATATLAGSAHVNLAAAPERYSNSVDATSYDFTKACLERVVAEYFRDEDEVTALAPNNGASSSGDLWLARVDPPGTDDWKQSLSLDGTEETPDPMQGPTDPVWDDYLEQWQKMRELRLTNLTWEGWLESFGIKGVEVEKPQRPELLRYSKSWTYPSNTVDASTGVPTSAVSWSIAERADKKRFFKEPGFIFGVTVARPKVYFSAQVEVAANTLMNSAYSWMAPVLRENPETSLRKFASTAGPLAGNVGANSYWVDVRDLLLYGDQFLNFSLAETDNGLVALPGSALTKAAMRYPSNAMIEGLFTSASATGTKAGRQIRQDGILALDVKGAQVDFT